jgi:undecaprenyl-diphosphatase
VNPIEQFDETVEMWFDRVRGNKPVDRLMYSLSEVADFSVLWHLLGTAQGLVRRDGFERTVRLWATLGAESLVINGAVKSVFRRSRPVPEFDRPHYLRIPKTSSFPSGHASAAFAAAALLSDGSRSKPVYYSLAALVAASRVYVRIHHASDVLAGAAVGAGVGALAKRIWRIRPLSSAGARPFRRPSARAGRRAAGSRPRRKT